MLLRTGARAALVVLATLGGVWACASEVDETPGPKPDSKPLPQPAGEGEITQRGRILVAQSQAPLDGATITVGARTTTAAADGTYAIVAPRGVPYAMTVSAPEHYTLLEQEWIAEKDIVRSDTTMLPDTLAALLAALLPNRDAEKGVLVVRVNAVRGCAGAGGTTLTLEPPGASLRYFAGGLPSGAATSVVETEPLSAVFYDVPIGVPLRVTASSPRCPTLPFPVSEEDVTYTGNVVAQAGTSLSYVRVFLGGGPDAGGPDAGDAGDAGPGDAGAADASEDASP